MPYPQLLSWPRVSTSESDDTLLEAFRQVTITIPLVDVIQHIPSYAKFLKGLCTPTRKPKHIYMSKKISSIMLSTLPHKRHARGAPMSLNPVIIFSQLDQDQEERLLAVLQGRKGAIGWNLSDLKGNDPSL